MFNKHTLLNVMFLLCISFSLFSQPTPPSGKNWVAVPLLTDEFNGTSLDATKWQNTHRNWAGREPSQFLPANVSVAGGNLQLKSTASNTTMQGNWVNSAVVQSKGRTMKAGMYSEARIKCSKLSMTTAFWFQGDYSEIDRQENFGAPSSSSWTQLANTDQINTHYFPGGFDLGDTTTPKFINNLSPGVGDTYYTYGVWWKDSRNIVIYLNGVKRDSITLPYDFNETMFTYFDTETFTWGVGLPTLASLQDNTKNTGYIDYVRTWELKDSPIIANGTYYIKSKVTNQNILSRAAESYKVIMNPPGNYTDQQWVFTHLGNNIYNIKNVATNRYLEVLNSTCSNGATLSANISGTANNQKWQVIANGSGIYGLKPVNCSTAGIDVPNGALLATLQIYTYGTTNNNQKWIIKPLASGAKLNEEVLMNEDDLKDMDIKLYPMPFENELNVIFSEDISAVSDVKLLGLDGKIVQNLQNYTFNNKQISIETANISFGTYILKIDTDKGVVSKKIVKQQ